MLRRSPVKTAKHVQAFKQAKDLKVGHIIVDPNTGVEYRVNAKADRSLFVALEIVPEIGPPATIRVGLDTYFRVLI
jgi:hypothetical protein